MWICPDCGEKLEDHFDSCWKCADKIAAPAATNTTTTKRRKGCVAAIIGMIVFVFFVVPLGLKFTTHTAYKSSSPTGLGVACFFEESDAMVSVVVLHVKDFEKSRFNLIEVGELSGFKSNIYPKRAVWSRDGTIVAVKAGYVGESRDIEWTHAYDFRLHKAYGDAASKVISELVASRGGEGEVILSDEESYKSLSRPYYPWELFPLSKFP
jgi:hypothetical protein